MTKIARGVGALLLSATFLAGCVASPDRDSSTPRATLTPGWTAIREAAAETVKEPRVWMPLAGAAIFQFDNWDRRTSNWARRNTPLFGSTTSADHWSNRLRAVPAVVEIGSILVLPVEGDWSDWVERKVELGTVDIASVGSSLLVDRELKTRFARLRPNGADRESLPSGHATAAAANATVAALNLQHAPWSESGIRLADWTLDASVYGTGWARVEAGWHYPSDVLAGIALGNLLAGFVHRSFVRGGSVDSVSLIPDRGGAQLRVRWTF